MTKIADPVTRGGQLPRELGRNLREVRRTQGLSRAEVARSAGLTRRELAAYERGSIDVPESDLWCLAGSCGVDVAELLPERARLILAPLPLPQGNGGRIDPYAALRAPEPLDLVDFFSMPRAEDPFSPPPALDPPTARVPATVGVAMHGGNSNGHHDAPVAAPLAPIAWVAPDGTPAAKTNGDVGGGRCTRDGVAWRVGGIFPPETATADAGAIALRRADARWALADLDAPGDSTIEATVDFTVGAGFGVLFRATVDDHGRITGYSFDIDAEADGGYVVRQWGDNRQHRPLAQTTVADPSRLYGRHALQVVLTGDHLIAMVDGDTVLTVPDLSHASIGLGHEPCRGGGVGVQAWATSEVTVDTFRVARA